MSNLTQFIFYAWVPLLLMAEMQNRYRFFLYALLSMFIWNVSTTWWVWNASPGGSIGAFILNSFFMTLPWWGFHIIKNNFGRRLGLLSLVAFWMSFEYIHLHWQLSWPWLTLGNAFATNPGWVQWYEVTGTSGGTLWIVLLNISFFELYRSYAIHKQQRTKQTRLKAIALAALSLGLLIIPFVISFSIKPTINDSIRYAATTSNIVIVQPNVDPYNEKFVAGNTDAIIQRMIDQSEGQIDDNTRLVVWPETALPVPVWQNQVLQNLYYKPVVDFIARHRNLVLITGIETYKNYGTNKATITARKNENEATWYDGFNAAVLMQFGQPPIFYNKSKLVPGVESLPDFLFWLGPVFEKFGGTAGGYGKDTAAAVFSAHGNPYKAAPIICYESIYGEYIASYVAKGANLLTIITNDGWWGNTPGYKQHLNYARLHAVETRRWIARSANTGISAVIDDRGNLWETRGWNERAAIKFNIPPTNTITFFVARGDVLSPVAMGVAGLLILLNLWLIIKKRFLKKRHTL